MIQRAPTRSHLSATAAALLILIATGTPRSFVMAQNDFDLGCAGLMPYCTLPIFKCGDEPPLCGGNVENIVKNCATNLFVCDPRSEGDGDDFKVIFDMDGPDVIPKTWDWPGWEYFSDVCTTIGQELLNCKGMSYQCDDKPAICSGIENEELGDQILEDCYRLRLCAGITAKETNMVDTMTNLIESTVEGRPSMHDANYFKNFFVISSAPTTAVNTKLILLSAAVATIAASLVFL